MNVSATSVTTARGCAHVKTNSERSCRNGTEICNEKIGAATAGPKKPKKRSSPAAREDIEAGRPTMECIHPNKKPQTGPKPRRKYAYSPPASGIAAPSSAKASAP